MLERDADVILRERQPGERDAPLDLDAETGGDESDERAAHRVHLRRRRLQRLVAVRPA